MPRSPRSWATGWSTRPRPAPKRSCSPRSRPPGRTDPYPRPPGPSQGSGRQGSPGRGAVTAESPKPQAFAWLGALFLAAAFVAGQFLRWEGLPGLRYAALACAVAGVLFAWVPMFTLRRHGRAPVGKSYMHATVVVERGPFALLRHPQYLGYMLFAATAALISRHWAVAALAAAAVVALYVHTLEEERDCLRRFGESYARYMERVPRFNVFTSALRALRCRARSS